MDKKLLIPILLMFLFAIHAMAEEALRIGYDFKHWNTEQGLSQNTVNAIVQDSAGYIWMATSNGINKFNGESFKTYSSTDSPLGLQSNNVTSLFVDSKGRILATTVNGLGLYDRQKDYFIDISKQLEFDELITHVADIKEDKLGRLWMCSTAGLYRINLADRTTKRFVPEPALAAEFKNLRTISYTPGDTLVVVASHKLYSIDPITASYRQLAEIPDFDGKNNYVMAMECDRAGNIWTGTHLGQIYLLERRASKFQQINSPQSNLVNDIVVESDTTLLISFDYSGLYRYYIDPKKWEYIYDIGNYQAKIITNKIKTVFIDQQNILWVGHTQNGVSSVEISPTGFYSLTGSGEKAKLLPFPIISSIQKDNAGNFLIGSDGGGIIKFSDEFSEAQTLTHTNTEHSLPNDAVLTIFKDSKGRIWVGTYRGGLSLYDPDRDKFTTYTHDDNNPESIGGNDVRAIVEDENGYLWLTTHGNGFSKFDPELKTFTAYSQTLNMKPDLSNFFVNDWTYDITIDGNKDLWITSSVGVTIFNPRDSIATNFLYEQDNGINLYGTVCRTVFCDSQKQIWLGSENGLFKYDASKKLLDRIGNHHGLAQENISAIVEADRVLWISTGKGIYRYNPETGEEKRYTAKEGLQGSEFFPNSSFKDTDGTIYFGGTNGFTYFKPSALRKNDLPPSLDFEDIRVMGASISKEKLLQREITLPFNQNFINISFIAINYINFEKNQYRYILEGVDKQWQTGGIERRANYTSLPPGEYTFKLKGANNDEVWNDTGIQFAITILSPWWATWWFRLLSIGLFMGGLIVFYYRRMSIVKRQQILLEHKVKVRTIELQKANNFLQEKAEIITKKNGQLEDKNIQIETQNFLLTEKQYEIEAQHQQVLNQQEEILAINEELLAKNNQLAHHEAELLQANEKLQALINTKDKMLSIIAHDLKNPMNTLIGFSSLILGKAGTFPVEKMNKFIEMINSASVNSYRLLENLLTWARSQTGNIHLERKHADISPLIDEVVHMFTESATRKNITIKYTPNPNEKHNAYFDENTISTIIRNIVSNAIKFTREGGEISLKSKIDSKIGMLIVSICDNGVGMTEAQKIKLFKVENNNTTNGTDDEHGTGLGLVICKEFIDMNKGWLEVHSEVNSGTCFELFIPLSK